MSTIQDKVIVLDNDLDVMEKRLHRALFLADTEDKFLVASSNYDTFMTQYGYYSKVAHQMNDNAYKRVQRVKEHVSNVIKDGKAIFLTLTFTDDVLASTNALTRRRYVSRFLKMNSSVYVANLDFGKKKEREHYHALVKADKVDFTQWHIYGAIKSERVRNSDADVARTSKYTVKLTRHALKETAKNPRLIYSRPSRQ